MSTNAAETRPSDSDVTGCIKRTVHTLPLTSITVAGVVGAGVYALFSKLTSRRCCK